MPFWWVDFSFSSGVVGIESSIRMIREHEYMGFLNFCDD